MLRGFARLCISQLTKAPEVVSCLRSSAPAAAPTGSWGRALSWPGHAGLRAALHHSAAPLQQPSFAVKGVRHAWNAALLRGNSSLASAALGSQAAPEYGAAALAAGLTAGQRRALTWWLGGCAGWVFSLVILGGVTRLTRSGLSMTDWKLTGETPPSSPEEWEAEFARYRLSPEFLKVNASMDVEGFKFIYWMEWAHRMWGRGLGAVFALPAATFVAAGAMTRPLARRLGLLLLMGGTQGLVGWWMVRSGLQQPENNAVPRVSPYRLAAHLTSAFAIYATLVWTALGLAQPYPPALAAGPSAARAAASLARVALPVAALVAVTAASGAFVAGLDAGRAYNTFPLMQGRLVPEDYWSVPGWRNAFESTAAVQLHHRVLALSTLAAVAALWRHGTRLPALPRASRLLLHGLAAGAGVQVALGVTTLLTHVPVSLGSAHQGGALTLFTLVLALMHSVRGGPTLAPFALLAARWTTPAAAAAVVGVGSSVVHFQ